MSRQAVSSATVPRSSSALTAVVAVGKVVFSCWRTR